MNKWQKVLDIINEVQGTDIKMGEEFEIEEGNSNPYKFTEKGVVNCNDSITTWINTLLNGGGSIKQIRNKPKVGDRYIIISFSGELLSIVNMHWSNDGYDNSKWDNGLGFHLHEKEKAERVIKKMMEVARNDK